MTSFSGSTNHSLPECETENRAVFDLVENITTETNAKEGKERTGCEVATIALRSKIHLFDFLFTGCHQDCYLRPSLRALCVFVVNSLT
jgi:hypothetical protein